MFNILLVVHSILCVVLMGLVLIQQGKGADMGAAFGGNSTTLFGASGAADFLTKLTTGIAIAFMISSILLVRAYARFDTSPSSVASPLEGSVMVGEEAAVSTEAVTESAPASPVEQALDPQAAPAAVGEGAASGGNPPAEAAAPQDGAAAERQAASKAESGEAAQQTQ